MGVYVACITERYRHLFEDKCRLYAFPMAPKLPVGDEFVIIDSGAYGLSLQGKEIDAEHMFRLSRFYRKYGAGSDFPVLGIAPDKFLDPRQTMRNYDFWREHIGRPVVPVIQFSKKRIDVAEAMFQIDKYAGEHAVVCVSNPSLRGRQAAACRYVVEHAKKKGIRWVHCLGAGWNTLDCRDWFDLGFDSIDSIAYYTDANRQVEWTPLSYQTRNVVKSVEEVAVRNFQLAISNCKI